MAEPGPNIPQGCIVLVKRKPESGLCYSPAVEVCEVGKIGGRSHYTEYGLALLGSTQEETVIFNISTGIWLSI